MQYEFATPTQALEVMAKHILAEPTQDSRAGKVKELTFINLLIGQPLKREILTPQRKASLPAQIAETMWVLSGSNDIEWLSRYLPRAADFSDDGKVWRAGYGPRLRNWRGVDQLEQIVRLLRQDRTTRRAVISIFDPAEDFVDSKDIPCNNWLHFLARDGYLDLNVAIRSNDLIWGWSGINQFEWSVLLEVVAGLTGLKVGMINYNISTLHIYERHWEKAASYQEVREDNFTNSPRFNLPVTVRDLDQVILRWFELEKVIREEAWHGELCDAVLAFPEPMMRSWLIILAWHWNGRNPNFLTMEGIEGTRLAEAARLSPGGKSTALSWHDTSGAFTDYVINLHNEKHIAYGNSWKKRGEQIGIMANLARKIDRLGVTGAGDTATDTAIDLLVYLAKYSVWLEENTLLPDGTKPSDGTEWANRIIHAISTAPYTGTADIPALEALLTFDFSNLEHTFGEDQDNEKDRRLIIVNRMLPSAFVLASRLWWQDQYRAQQRDKEMTK